MMHQEELGQGNVKVPHLIMVIHQYNCMFLSKACQGLKEKKCLSCYIICFMFTSIEIFNSLLCHNNKRQSIHSTSQPKKEAENRNILDVSCLSRSNTHFMQSIFSFFVLTCAYMAQTRQQLIDRKSLLLPAHLHWGSTTKTTSTLGVNNTQQVSTMMHFEGLLF